MSLASYRAAPPRVMSLRMGRCFQTLLSGNVIIHALRIADRHSAANSGSHRLWRCSRGEGRGQGEEGGQKNQPSAGGTRRVLQSSGSRRTVSRLACLSSKRCGRSEYIHMCIFCCRLCGSLDLPGLFWGLVSFFMPQKSQIIVQKLYRVAVKRRLTTGSPRSEIRAFGSSGEGDHVADV